MSSHRNEAISIRHIRAVVREQVSNQANRYCHFVLPCTFLVNVSLQFIIHCSISLTGSFIFAQLLYRDGLKEELTLDETNKNKIAKKVKVQKVSVCKRHLLRLVKICGTKLAPTSFLQAGVDFFYVLSVIIFTEKSCVMSITPHVISDKTFRVSDFYSE